MPRSLFSELRRRKVFRAAALYAAAAWVLVQVATQVFPLFEISQAVQRGIVLLLILGFPFWVALAWLYELTPEGIRRESQVDPSALPMPGAGRKLDRWIIGLLAGAVVVLLANTFVWHRRVATSAVSEADGVYARSVAVLPFESLSTDREQGFFAAGISEDLLDLLTRIPGLRVAARTSSFSFKGDGLEVREIARRLNVAHVLEGSVRRAGDSVRVSVQLVNAADGYQVWAGSWDRKLDDVFAIQEEIALDVAAQLQARLLGAAPEARQTDPRAYELYLQAREVARQFTPDALLRSDSLHRQVLSIDPRYVPAWVKLSTNFTSETSIGVLSNEEGLRRAREAAWKALAIDSTYAPAHGALAWVAILESDLAGAARDLERALALDPAEPGVLANSALLLQSLGRVNEAIPLQEYLAARDPVNVTRIHNLGVLYVWAGRYDDAITRFRTVLNLSPGAGSVHFLIGEAILLKGDAPTALAELQQEPSEIWRLIGLSMVYHALGRSAASDSALVKLVEEYQKDWSYNIAYVYAYRAEADRAFAWLDRAVQYGDPGLSFIAIEDLFNSVRSDPRWLPFLRRVGRAPEQLEKIEFRVAIPQADPGALPPQGAGMAAPR